MITRYPPAHIKRKCPHRGPHFDEALESVLVDRFGTQWFIGAFSAKIVPKKMHCSEEECLKNGDLLLGQGQRYFDDKGLDGKRLPDTCCAFRMAEYLGISRMEALYKLYKAAKRVDSTQTANDFDISRLMKDAIASLPEEEHPQAFRWLEIGINAIIDYLLLCHSKGRVVECANYVLPQTVLNDMFRAKDPKIGLIDNRAINRMRDLAKTCSNRVDSCIELSAVSRAMKATGRSNEDAIEWMRFALKHNSTQQVNYQNALLEIAERAEQAVIEPRFEGDEMNVLYIESDNPQIAKASRAPSLNCGVCIVKRSKGNISFHQNNFYHLDMGAVDALVRIMETPEAERANADFGEYSREGNIPQAPHLHVQENGNILNGSDNIEAERIADLGKDDAISIVQYGFTDDAVLRFNHLRGGGGTLSESETAYLEMVRPKYAEAQIKIADAKKQQAEKAARKEAAKQK